MKKYMIFLVLMGLLGNTQPEQTPSEPVPEEPEIVQDDRDPLLVEAIGMRDEVRQSDVVVLAAGEEPLGVSSKGGRSPLPDRSGLHRPRFAFAVAQSQVPLHDRAPFLNPFSSRRRTTAQNKD